MMRFILNIHVFAACKVVQLLNCEKKFQNNNMHLRRKKRITMEFTEADCAFLLRYFAKVIYHILYLSYHLSYFNSIITSIIHEMMMMIIDLKHECIFVRGHARVTVSPKQLLS